MLVLNYGDLSQSKLIFMPSQSSHLKLRFSVFFFMFWMLIIFYWKITLEMEINLFAKIILEEKDCKSRKLNRPHFKDYKYSKHNFTVHFGIITNLFRIKAE